MGHPETHGMQCRMSFIGTGVLKRGCCMYVKIGVGLHRQETAEDRGRRTAAVEAEVAETDRDHQGGRGHAIGVIATEEAVLAVARTKKRTERGCTWPTSTRAPENATSNAFSDVTGR